MESPESFDKMLEKIEKNEFYFKKKIFFNDGFLWAARMQQFWQTEEILAKILEKNLLIFRNLQE